MSIALGVLMALAVVTVQAKPADQPPSPDSTVALEVAPAFTYQGRLVQNGAPVTGVCDFEYSLYDDATGGTLISPLYYAEGRSVDDGLFATEVFFGDYRYQDDAHWLQVAVRCPAGSGSFTTLTPRQRLRPAPYAMALPGLWTQPHANSPNLIGGYKGNGVASGVYGATIGGGGQYGSINRATADFATIGGGESNTVTATHATIGGGAGNLASGEDATIGGGWGNTASGEDATIGGGYRNIAVGESAAIGGGASNAASGGWTAVSGGRYNVVNAPYGTIAGGGYATEAYGNRVTDEGGTVGGGGNNQAGDDAGTTADAYYATVGGGWANTASDSYATVPGGDSNTAAGNYSFAAGRRAKALNAGCFVWGDSTDDNVTCGNDDRWVVRASGGVYFYSSSDLGHGVHLAAGADDWSPIWTSDRDQKMSFAPVDGGDIVARLAEVPITTWSYAAGDPAVRHIGPVSQDFYAAFGLGEDDRHISAVDANGVALAAIQGLYREGQERETQIAALRQQNDALRQQNEDLAARMTALEQSVGAGHLPASSLLLGGLLVLGTMLTLCRRTGGRL